MTEELRLELWQILSSTYEAIAQSLRPSIPDLRMQSGHNRNDAFLFRSYAEYWVNDDNSVVLSLDIQSVGGRIHISGDISRSSGFILDETLDSMIDSEAELASYVREFASACEANVSLICPELAGSSSDSHS